MRQSKIPVRHVLSRASDRRMYGGGSAAEPEEPAGRDAPSRGVSAGAAASPGAGLSRRDILKAVSAAGIGSAVFGRALVTLAAEKGSVTPEMIRRASWIAGLDLTKDQRKLMVEGLQETRADYALLRAIPIDNAVPPAIRFDPDPPGVKEHLQRSHGDEVETTRARTRMADARTHPADAGAGAADAVTSAADAGTLAAQAGTRAGRASTAEGLHTPPDVPQADGSAPLARPKTSEDLAFASVATLSALLRSRKISSVELTRLYLDRLARFDPTLRCVITPTQDLALRQAEQADREIASGHYRGPLHGVPWGAKDLLAVPGYPTSWGAGPFKDQVRPEKASVVARLEEAGAVLLGKLAVGELAWGDVWYGGTTKNPWKTDQGSSGSSAGSASATAAGLMAFAIGTETLGSIVSPSTRCGVTGLRPTFGRVSRHGAMALAWSMDKIGTIARSAEDCALVFDAIHGRDGLDPTAVDRPFEWPTRREARTLKVGFTEDLFKEDRAKGAGTDSEKRALEEWQEIDRGSLEALRRIGIDLVPIKLPDDLPIAALGFILSAEAAAAFDELTRSGRDAKLVRQIANAWPTVFRQGQLVPAVEYIRANRIRTLAMRAMEKLMTGLDAYVAPSFGGHNLLLTNLTGHPCVVLPNGFRPSSGTPTSLSFIGKLFGESDLLALAHAFQQATDFHLRRPPLFAGSAVDAR